MIETPLHCVTIQHCLVSLANRTATMRFSCLWLSLMLSLVLIYAFNRGHTPTASPRVNLVSRGRGGGGEQRARWLRSAEMLQMSLITHYEEISVPTGRNINLQDITSKVDDVVQKTKVKEGVVTVLSKHSTVSVVIQEFEQRQRSESRRSLCLRVSAPRVFGHRPRREAFRREDAGKPRSVRRASWKLHERAQRLHR